MAAPILLLAFSSQLGDPEKGICKLNMGERGLKAMLGE